MLSPSSPLSGSDDISHDSSICMRTRGGGGFGTAFGRMSFEKESALKSLKKLSCHCDHPKRNHPLPKTDRSVPGTKTKKYDPPSPLRLMAGHEKIHQQKLNELDNPKLAKSCSCKAATNDSINEQRKSLTSTVIVKTRDAATSPPTAKMRTTAGVGALKSPKVVIDGKQFDFETISSAVVKHGNMELTNRGTSPRKATTDSQLSPKTTVENMLSPLKNTATNPRLLEKSNSLGEQKPRTVLRTTRSLSPRPPVRHQHSIMVSDENDIVSIKLSPHEDFDDVFNKNKINAVRSACASPKMSTASSLKVQYKQQQNKSTSCLEYVPTDPWTKMGSPQKREKVKQPTQKMGKKSMSKPNLENYVTKSHDLDENGGIDPWIWRSATNISIGDANSDGGKISTKKLKEKNNSLTISATLDTNKQSTKNNKTRPKLQRSKSPICHDEPQFILNPAYTLNKIKSISSSKVDNVSQQSPASLKYQADIYNKIKYKTNNHNNTANMSSLTNGGGGKSNFSNPSLEKKTTTTTLNVINQNLLQPRHSFSATTTQQLNCDDELTLNIRRLSEQVKYTTNYFNFNNANLQQQPQFISASGDSNKKTVKTDKKLDKVSVKTTANALPSKDSLLETTC